MLKIGSLLVSKQSPWRYREVLLVESVGYAHDEYCEDHQDLGYHCVVIIGHEPNTRWFSCKYIDETGLESWIIV